MITVYADTFYLWLVITYENCFVSENTIILCEKSVKIVTCIVITLYGNDIEEASNNRAGHF